MSLIVIFILIVIIVGVFFGIIILRILFFRKFVFGFVNLV